MIRSRAQIRFRSRNQLMLITVWKSLSTPSGMARARMVAMLVSPAWVSRDAGRSDSACRRVPTAVLATAIGHRRVRWARPCGARTEDSARVAPRMPADLSAEPRRPTALRTSTDSSPATSLGYRDRRLCRPPDWADPDTACVVQREIPTRDIGTILFGCPGGTPAPRRHCRRRTCLLLPDPQRRDWNETLARMRFAFRPAVRFLCTSTRESSLRPVRARVGPLGLCRPRRPATLFRRGRARTTSAQSQGRHNAEQGRRVRRSRRARTRSFGVLI
jgi:hypothetical protein